MSEETQSHRPQSGNLRAMCVRTCDGFYWPVAERVTRGRLYTASDRCKSSCQTEAKLFFHERDDVEPAAMVDLAGRRYDEHPNAFLYRKKLVAGCTCRPDPWSRAERMRHAEYKLDEIRAQARLAERQDEKEKLAGKTSAPVPVAASNMTTNFDRMDVQAEGAVEAPAPWVVSAAEQAGGSMAADNVLHDGAPLPAPVVEGGIASIRGRAAYETAPRQRAWRERQPRRASAQPSRPKQQPAPGFSLFGGGSKKYVWPGDAR